jgi:hypothetical protein
LFLNARWSTEKSVTGSPAIRENAMMNKAGRKRTGAALTRTSVSLATDVYCDGEERRKALGYRSFSHMLSFEYGRTCVRGRKHVRVREEPANAEIKKIADEMMKPRATKGKF